MQQQNIHDYKSGTFQTATGRTIDLLNPTLQQISIDDIGHALSNLCRFGGHTYPFYSVAQHSCLVAALAPPPLKLAALLHDASEAYLGDVIKPLKSLLGATYTTLEDEFMQVIGDKFGIPQSDFAAVLEYDLRALEIEDEALRQRKYSSLIFTMENYGLLHGNWAWTAPVAEHEFLNFFLEYFDHGNIPTPVARIREDANTLWPKDYEQDPGKKIKKHKTRA